MDVSPSFSQNRFLQMVLAAYALVWIGTAINPRDWKETFHLERNHFDRIVHFSFGLMAYPAHEVLVRVTQVRGFWALVLPAAVIVSFSGFFEVLEAVIAILVNPELGAAYLGLQGDVWDAQKDMALAILGSALVMSLTRRRFYKRSRSSVTPSSSAQ